MLPVGAALATGLIENAPAVGTLVGQGIASAVDPAAKAYRQQMKTDIKALKQGQLGLSDAEKRTMLAGTQRALQAQTSAAEASLRRSAAAMGGFGRSGAQQAALGQMGAAQREKMAEVAGGVDAQSQALAQQRFASIMNRLAQKRVEAMETGREAGKAGGEVIKTTAEAFAGLKKEYDDQQLKYAEEEAKKRAQASLDALAKMNPAFVPDGASSAPAGQ